MNPLDQLEEKAVVGRKSEKERRSDAERWIPGGNGRASGRPGLVDGLHGMTRTQGSETKLGVS